MPTQYSCYISQTGVILCDYKNLLQIKHLSQQLFNINIWVNYCDVASLITACDVTVAIHIGLHAVHGNNVHRITVNIVQVLNKPLLFGINVGFHVQNIYLIPITCSENLCFISMLINSCYLSCILF